MTADVTTPRSRRSLLTAAAGGAAAAAAATIARAAPASAEDETVKVGGEYTTATSRTFLKNSTTDSDVLVVTTNGSGKAIWGKSTDGTGVLAESVHGVGLEAAGKQFAIHASGQIAVRADGGVAGVLAGGTGTGVIGEGGDLGVFGGSGSGYGIHGSTRTGVGVLATAVDGLGHALRTDGGRVRFDQVSGVATIPAGARSVVVDPGVGIDGSSFVLLTPKANIGSRGLWFTTNKTADTFRIRMSSARTGPTKVAWLLVG